MTRKLALWAESAFEGRTFQHADTRRVNVAVISIELTLHERAMSPGRKVPDTEKR